MTDKKILKLAKDEIEKLLQLLDVETELSAEIVEADTKEKEVDYKYVKAEIKGEELGALIGFRGRNLSSLQYIAGLVINRQLDEEDRGKIRVIIDVNDYRDARAEKIKEMANARIEELRASGETELEMPPMKPEERRVVHLLVKEMKDVESESVDEGRLRRVKLILKK